MKKHSIFPYFMDQPNFQEVSELIYLQAGQTFDAGGAAYLIEEGKVVWEKNFLFDVLGEGDLIGTKFSDIQIYQVRTKSVLWKIPCGYLMQLKKSSSIVNVLFERNKNRLKRQDFYSNKLIFKYKKAFLHILEATISKEDNIFTKEELKEIFFSSIQTSKEEIAAHISLLEIMDILVKVNQQKWEVQLLELDEWKEILIDRWIISDSKKI